MLKLILNRKDIKPIRICIIKILFNIEDKYFRFDEKILFEEHNGYKIANLVQSYEMKCPICGKKMLKNGFKSIKIKTFPINKTLTFLVIKKQKYLCKPSTDCPQMITKIAEVKGVQPKHRIANSVNESIVIDLAKNRSIKDIAQDNNVSSSTVSIIIFVFNVSHHWLPRVICLDDFKFGSALHDEMSMVLMNAENHQVIDVIKSRKNQYLKSYFLRFDRKAR